MSWIASKLFGADRVKRMMQAASRATGEVLDSRRVTKKILSMQQDRFAISGSNPRAQKSPDGVDWKPLNYKAIKRVKNKNTGGQILVDKDKLRKSIVIARDDLRSATRVGVGTATIAVRRVQNRRVRKDGSIDVRYTDEYAKVHQYGGSPSRVPARPFLGLGKSDLTEIGIYMTNTLNKFFTKYS